MRKFLLFLLTGCLLVSAAACGQKESNTNQKKDNEISTEVDNNKDEDETKTHEDEDLNIDSSENKDQDAEESENKEPLVIEIDEAHFAEIFNKLVEEGEPGCYDLEGNLLHKMTDGECFFEAGPLDDNQLRTRFTESDVNLTVRYDTLLETHNEGIVIVIPDDVDLVYCELPENVCGFIGRGIKYFAAGIIAEESCTNLYQIHVSENCHYVSDCMYDTPWYKNLDETEETIIFGGTLMKHSCGDDGVMTLPDGIKGVSGDIGKRTGIKGTKLICPESLIYIDNGAFENCGFTEIVLNEGLKYLGQSAFYNWNEDISINYPESLEVCFVQERLLFIEDKLVDGVYIKDGVLLAVDENMETLVITDDVRLLPSYLLYASSGDDCKIKTLIVESTKVKSIPNSFIKGCYSLETVVLPDNIKYIETDAFRKCSNLTSITLGNGVTHIAEWAFKDTGITELYIPDSIVYMNPYDFKEIHLSIPKHMEEAFKYYIEYYSDSVTVRN